MGWGTYFGGGFEVRGVYPEQVESRISELEIMEQELSAKTKALSAYSPCDMEDFEKQQLEINEALADYSETLRELTLLYIIRNDPGQARAF